MDRRERERIIGEHAPREMTDREQREAERLVADLEGSPVTGKPLPRRLRNFSPSVEGYALSIAGPPAYAQRLRMIEDEIAAHEERAPSRVGRASAGASPIRTRGPAAGARPPSAGTSTPSTT